MTTSKPKPVTGSQVVLPERLRAARERAGMTQLGISIRAHELTADTKDPIKLAPNEISRLESGKGFDICGSKLVALAMALDCSLDYLVGLSAKPK